MKIVGETRSIDGPGESRVPARCILGGNGLSSSVREARKPGRHSPGVRVRAMSGLCPGTSAGGRQPPQRPWGRGRESRGWAAEAGGAAPGSYFLSSGPDSLQAAQCPLDRGDSDPTAVAIPIRPGRHIDAQHLVFINGPLRSVHGSGFLPAAARLRSVDTPAFDAARGRQYPRGHGHDPVRGGVCPAAPGGRWSRASSALTRGRW